MGRGRQKAKQTKVARELKYFSPDTNYRALEQELTSHGRNDVVTDSRPRGGPTTTRRLGRRSRTTYASAGRHARLAAAVVSYAHPCALEAVTPHAPTASRTQSRSRGLVARPSASRRAGRAPSDRGRCRCSWTAPPVDALGARDDVGAPATSALGVGAPDGAEHPRRQARARRRARGPRRRRRPRRPRPCPTPRLSVPSRSRHGTCPSRCTRREHRRQRPRRRGRRRRPGPAGSTRATFAASPPPVTWLNACTPATPARSDQREAVASRRRGWARAAPRRACGPARRRGGPAPSRRTDTTVRTSEYPLECSPDEPSATSTSPARTRSGPSSRVGLDDARRGTGDVVLVGAEQAGVLGGLAADQRRPGDRAGRRDAAHDVRDALGHDPAARDVVGHEQRRRRRPRRCRRRPCRPGRSRWCRARPAPARSRPWCRRRRSRSPAAAGGSVSSALASYRPAKPPTPPSTCGPCVARTASFISSTALSPASVSTPAAAYVTRALRAAHGWSSAVAPPAPATRVSEPVLGRAQRQLVLLEQVLAEPVRRRQLDRVLPGEAGGAQLRRGLLGRGDHALRRDVAERVGAERRARSPRPPGRWR